MKKFFSTKFVIGILAIVLAFNFILAPLSVNAAVFNKTLQSNKDYFYDLDGDGKKEKIRYTSEGDYNSEFCNVILYINGEKKFSKKLADSYGGFYTIVDLNKKDPYLDLFLKATGSSDTLNYSIFQRYEEKKITTIPFIVNSKDHKFGFAELYRINELKQIDGKGNFSVVADTPFYFNELGSFYCYVPFAIKNKTITCKKTSLYELTPDAKKYNYIANKKINVFEKAKKDSKIIKTVSKGEMIQVLKIKISDKVIRNNYEHLVGYAYVIDKNGEKGWIYLDNNHSLFKTTPAWG